MPSGKQGQTGRPTWRSLIRQDVDDAIARSLTWKQFVQAMELKGYTMRFDRKYPILQPPEKTRSVRFKSLGTRYTPQAIRNRILYPRWRYPIAQQLGVWQGRLHGTYRKARKLTRPAGFVLSVPVRIGRTAPASRSVPVMPCGRISAAWTSASGRWNFCHGTV